MKRRRRSSTSNFFIHHDLLWGEGEKGAAAGRRGESCGCGRMAAAVGLYGIKAEDQQLLPLLWLSVSTGLVFNAYLTPALKSMSTLIKVSEWKFEEFLLNVTKERFRLRKPDSKRSSPIQCTFLRVAHCPIMRYLDVKGSQSPLD